MKVTFPHMGNLSVIIQPFFESLGIDVVVPPENSKRTLNLGSKFAPESSCLPLKFNLGNFIEAAEMGADTIAITGGIGPCRFGYYGEIERQILNDAGYPYDVVFLESPDGSFAGFTQQIRYLVGKSKSWTQILGAMNFAYHKILVMDRIEDMIHHARVLFSNPGEAEQLYSEANKRLASIVTYSGLKALIRWLERTIQEKKNAEKELTQQPLRIGIVGEIYTLLDPFSSADIERQLGQLGVLVDRSIYLSGWVADHILFGLAKGYRSIKACQLCAKPYLNHFVGGHGQESVGGAVNFAKKGFDGVIHLFPLTCMPEIVASSILPRVQSDYHMPIMTLIMDEHTGYAGVQTRLEAFVDLLERSRGSFTRGEILNTQ